MILKTIANSVLLIVLILVIGATTLYSVNKFDALRRQTLKNEAVTTCLAAASQQTSDPKTGTQSTYPLKDVYQKCMADKGYASLWK